MEKFNFNKKEKKPDAEQIKINFDNHTDGEIEEPKENENVSTEYDLEIIKELEKNGDIEEVDSLNNEDESYVDLKDLTLKDDVLNEKEDPGWDLFGRFNEIKRQKMEQKKNKLSNIKKSNIAKGSNEDRINKAFNRDNLK